MSTSMNNATLKRFINACIRDGRPEAISLGRVAFYRLRERRTLGI
jgi:hypothetical protein